MQNISIGNAINTNNIKLKTISAPSFLGAVKPELESDVVEISDKKEKKRRFGILLGVLGVAGAILAWIKCHKTSAVKEVGTELSAELKEVQKIYKEVFGREINAEETKDFAMRYKKIIDSKAIGDDREYCEKLLDEICKDRKTKRPPILRWIARKADADSRCINGGMATSPAGNYIDVYAYNYHNVEGVPPAKGFFESLFHETHHVKQDEMIYRTDKEFFLQDLVDKYVCNGEGIGYQRLLQQNNGDKTKTLQEVRQMISDNVNSYWGDLLPYDKCSSEYSEGLKLIEGKKKYKFFGDCINNSEYRSQIIEKGAYADGEKAERLFDILKGLTI